MAADELPRFARIEMTLPDGSIMSSGVMFYWWATFRLQHEINPKAMFNGKRITSAILVPILPLGR